MLVTVITPTYNNRDFIEANINSILSQRYKYVEHIVVDGKSTDRTIELLNSYPHLKWISEPDKGMYDAINKGIKMASGDIIAYLNSDDRYYDYTLELVVQTFDKYPEVDFVYGYGTYIDDRGKPLCTIRPLPYNSYIAPRGRVIWLQPTCFWRKRVHQKIGVFDKSLKIFGDQDFFERMLVSRVKGKLIRRPLAKFMLVPDCLSQRLSKIRPHEKAELAKRYHKSKTSWPYLFNEIVFAFLNIHTYYLRFLWKSGRYQRR